MRISYLDNAATTFPKPRTVTRACCKLLREGYGNPGRSSHRLSRLAAEEIYRSRDAVANLLKIKNPENICFTYNATYALNFAIKSLTKPNCHVLTSDFEHNSVIRPLEKLKKTRGISYSSFALTDDLEATIRSKIRPQTKAIVCSLSSNITGERIPIDLLSSIAKEYSLTLILDGSQAAGHYEIDLSENPCDAFCAPGHKALFGLMGCGFVYFKNSQRGESFIEGGSGFDSESLLMPRMLPEGYEAGTLAVPAIFSLRRGIEFLEAYGISEAENRLNSLTQRLTDMLSEIEGVKIYAANNGIVSFNFKDFSSSKIETLLDEDGICVRGGLHCAPTVHKRLGTIKQGAIRASLSILNKESDLERLYRSMKKISKQIK